MLPKATAALPLFICGVGVGTLQHQSSSFCHEQVRFLDTILESTLFWTTVGIHVCNLLVPTYIVFYMFLDRNKIKLMFLIALSLIYLLSFNFDWFCENRAILLFDTNASNRLWSQSQIYIWVWDSWNLPFNGWPRRSLQYILWRLYRRKSCWRYHYPVIFSSTFFSHM